MKWLLIYMVSLYALWHAIDTKADSVLESAIAPFTFAVVLIAFLVWLRSKVSGGHPRSMEALAVLALEVLGAVAEMAAEVCHVHRGKSILPTLLGSKTGSGYQTFGLYLGIDWASFTISCLVASDGDIRESALHFKDGRS